MNFLDSLNNLRDKITPTKKGNEILNDINIVEEESSEEDLVNFEVTDNKKRSVTDLGHKLRLTIKI
jgi:hypothetical protein